jgi:hypothetical protein
MLTQGGAIAPREAGMRGEARSQQSNATPYPVI